MKYILVKWPESQEFMENEECFLINEPEKVGPAAYMVPEYLIENDNNGRKLE